MTGCTGQLDITPDMAAHVHWLTAEAIIFLAPAF